MPWPKGVSRKGYVKKDGKPHQPRRSSQPSPSEGRESTGIKVSGKNSLRTKLRIVQQSASGEGVTTSGKKVASPTPASEAASFSPSRGRSWSTKLAHPQYVIEECPNCSFPEADGGYCPECGWQLPLTMGPLVYGVK